MNLLSRVLLISATWLAASFCANHAAAQVTPIPGTGCPNSTPTLTSAPNIGTTMSIGHQFPCNSPGGFGVVAVGAQMANVTVQSCFNGPCVIGVLPSFLMITPITARVQLAIPNDPALVGVCIFAQASCLFTRPPPACISNVHQAVQICIQ